MTTRFFCIYRITNLVNGKTYIGQHSYWDESNPMGKYFGSGILIKKAVKKYGKENFKREVLYRRILRQDTANTMEAMMIKKELLKGNCYNCDMTPSGGVLSKSFKNLNCFWEKYTSWWLGSKGYNYSNRKHGERMRGIKKDPEIGEKIKETKKLDPWHPTDEQRKRMSESAKKRDSSNNHTNQGKRWFTNGMINVMTFVCPHGFYPGFTKKGHWYTDGKNNLFVENELNVPEGFKKGRTL